MSLHFSFIFTVSKQKKYLKKKQQNNNITSCWQITRIHIFSRFRSGHQDEPNSLLQHILFRTAHKMNLFLYCKHSLGQMYTKRKNTSADVYHFFVGGCSLKKRLQGNEKRKQIAPGMFSHHSVYEPSGARSQKHLKANNAFFAKIKAFLSVHVYT